MKLRHSKPTPDEDIETAAESGNSSASPTASSTENWKCPSCGAENEDFRKFCDGCGDKRPGTIVASKGISMDDLLGTGGSSGDSSKRFEDMDDTSETKKGKKDKKSKKIKKDDEDEELAEPSRLEPSTAASQWFDSGSDQSSDDLGSKDSLDSNVDSDQKPSFVVTGPEPASTKDDSFTSPEPPAPPSTPSIQSTSVFSAPSETRLSGLRYYLVFVSTPASSLIKTRVMMEFEDFPTVTIGRSPENVVVVPDPEVSRKHASLNLNGGRLTLKDLGSSNGTFVYNGKEFERVSDSVEVRPNTVLKFGTGTIVKLVSE